eukprot:3043591-Alexandrium_andersonii.AAC.1
MSASLVGSEMCIRDSHRTATTQTQIRIPTSNRSQDASVAARILSACPVSYTHLTLPTICSV